MNFKKFKKMKGFTLVELIVVIAILALLAAIAIPMYNQSRTRSANTAHNSNVRILKGAAQNYLANEGNPNGTLTMKTGAGPFNGLEKYVDDPASIKVPSGVKGIEADSAYSITIENDGKITVSPGEV